VAHSDSVDAATPKRGRGRPPKYVIEPLPATAEEIRDAIFSAADRPEAPADDDPETA